MGYTAKCKLTLRDPEGFHVAAREDGASGGATHQPNRADAHHLALTSAVSTALKRAAKSLGNQFGLSLYDGGSLKSVVGSSLAYGRPAHREPEPQPERGYEVINGVQIPLAPKMKTSRSGPPSDLATPEQIGVCRRLLMEIGITDQTMPTWFGINITEPWPGMLNNLSKAQAQQVIDLLDTEKKASV